MKVQKIEQSVIDHCFLLLLNMSMDRQCEVYFWLSRRCVKMKMYIRLGRGRKWEENLPLITDFSSLSFVVVVCERMEMTFFHSLSLSLFRLQKDITMKWLLVTINFRRCNYPTKVHNHSIIQRMYRQSPVHLWHRR